MTDTAAQDDALETALDQWAVDHLEAAIALHKLVVEAMKTTGYRHIGKAIVGLEVPNDWHPDVYAGQETMTMLARVEHQPSLLSAPPRRATSDDRQDVSQPAEASRLYWTREDPERLARLQRDDPKRARGDPNAPIAAVYAIEHRRSGRRYVGVTVDLRARYVAHLSKLRLGKHNRTLQADWDSDGPDAFEWLVLEADGTYEAEEYWIANTPVALLYNYALSETHGMHRGPRAACNAGCSWEIGADERAERLRIEAERLEAPA